MRVKALKTFRGRYGLIRTGTQFDCDPGYYRQLSRNGMVELVESTKPADPGPSENRDLEQAPNRAGKSTAGGQGKPPADTVPPPAGGRAITSRSLRQDLASRRKTSTSSSGGASKPAKETPQSGPETSPNDPPPQEPPAA